jgi:hypothetical protein
MGGSGGSPVFAEVCKIDAFHAPNFLWAQLIRPSGCRCGSISGAEFRLNPTDYLCVIRKAEDSGGCAYVGLGTK